MSFADFTARLAHTAVPWWAARALSWLLAIHTTVTGWDYFFTPATAASSRSLTIVERIASLHAWGVVFLAAGLVLTLGLLVRRHFLVWLGHVLGAGLFFAFSIATAQAVWLFSQTPAADGQGPIWRAITQALLPTAGHLILCYVRGPVPRKGDER